MSTFSVAAPLSPWELAAEHIAVKIRWFGLLFGYILVNTSPAPLSSLLLLNAILLLGLGYAVIDTYYSLRGKVFLRRFPLLVSLMEAFFIGLLCYYHQGLDSPFRYYYFLSLICCAIRHASPITYTTCALHCGSYALLYAALPATERNGLTLLLTLVILGWVTWASDALACLLKRVGEHLGHLNVALQENQSQLEARIEERTRQLKETQAILLHQEKMAAFGLLAAGIAHEVGNPLTSISSLVQILQKRQADAYTQEKLGLVNGELRRIQATLRELINFSRPASIERSLVALPALVDEALNIAKYYKRTKQRRIVTALPADLPHFVAKRDLLVQALLNLILNAIDATDKNGQICIEASRSESTLHIRIQDNGCGITAEHQPYLFRPYFTTKADGTGLGLFVTQKLIEEQGGTLSFAATPAAGATFVISFPAAPAQIAAHSLRTQPAEAADIVPLKTGGGI